MTLTFPSTEINVALETLAVWGLLMKVEDLASGTQGWCGQGINFLTSDMWALLGASLKCQHMFCHSFFLSFLSYIKPSFISLCSQVIIRSRARWLTHVSLAECERNVLRHLSYVFMQSQKFQTGTDKTMHTKKSNQVSYSVLTAKSRHPVTVYSPQSTHFNNGVMPLNSQKSPWWHPQ